MSVAMGFGLESPRVCGHTGFVGGCEMCTMSAVLCGSYSLGKLSHKMCTRAVGLGTQALLGHHDRLSELSSLKCLFFCGSIHFVFWLHDGTTSMV